MFEILLIILFGWLLFKGIGLAVKVTWCAAKVFATILFAIALPTLIGCMLFAGGLILLLPVAMIAVAWGVLKAAV